MGATCPSCKQFNASICFNCGAYYGAIENKKVSKAERELAQSKARIEQLENHIGEMGSMIKFNEMTARIRELEDILVSIQGVIINNDNVRVQAKHIGSDLAVHLIFERIEKALSEKSDKEDGGE